MKPNDLAAMLALPMAARVEYEHEGGWSFATHSNGTEAENYRTLFDETQMRAYALAHIVAERERCAQLCEQWDATHPQRLAALIRTGA